MKILRLMLLASASCSSVVTAQSAQRLAVPDQAPTIVAGSATLSTDATGTVRTVTQSSDRAFLDWSTLNVPQNHTLRFNQPDANAITLNRVTGGSSSVVDGLIEANGQVWILNPNGVFISPTGRVTTPGFLASTGNISQTDFMDATTQLVIRSIGSSASIINQGAITNSLGYTILNASTIKNSGQIAVDRGTVLLASVDNLSVSFDQGRLISYELSNNSSASIAFRYITNTGKITANGGLVALSMASALGAISGVINTTGLIDASAARDEGGTIVLDGGPSGFVVAGGTLDVSGKGQGQIGGAIAVLGMGVSVVSGARLDASGSAGGGTINVGGGWQGTSVNGQASAVLAGVASGATLDASALLSGNGGEVTLWSDVANPLSKTLAYGTFLARGGTNGGNGGRIETSGHYLDTTGVTGSASAPLGAAGIWLFDPYNIEVVAAGSGSGPNIINPGFTEGLLGWSPYNAGFGSVVNSISASNGTFSPPSGSSGFFAIVDAGPLDVQRGLEQSFTATAGQSLTIYVIFVANDYLPFNDNGGISIVKPDGNIVTLFFSSVDQTGDYAATGFSTLKYDFDLDGTYTIQGFATNIGDGVVNSQLGFTLISSFSTSVNGAFSSIDNTQAWTPTASASKIDVSQIIDLLNAGTSVQIATGPIGSAGSDAGNITISAAINKIAGGNATLQLDAANAIFVNQAIGSSSGVLDVKLNAGSGGIELNDAVNTNGGTLTLNTTGTTSQNSALTTKALSLLGVGGSHLLTNAGNSFVTLTGNTGSVSLENGMATDVNGLKTAGQFNLSTPGAITIQGSNSFGQSSTVATTDSMTLVAGSTTSNAGTLALHAGKSFINQAGSGALTSSGISNWLIYSQDPTLNTFGDLASGNLAIWNQTPSSLSTPAAGSGDTYIFKVSPLLTVTASDAQKIYGDALPGANLPFTVTGLIDASIYGNVFTQDSISGMPELTSSGAVGTANVGSYVINAALGSLTHPAGYALNLVNGTLTVNPRPLLASLIGTVSRNYDGTTAALLSLGNFAFDGLVTGETITVTKSAGTFATPNVGSNLSISASLANADFTAGADTALSNYLLPTTASGAIGAILPRPLLASLIGTVSRNYDGTTAALLSLGNFAFDGLVTGETITVTKSAGTFANQNAGTSLLVKATLAIADFATGTGTDLRNYLLPTTASGTIGSILPLTLTYRANTAVRFLGAPNPAFAGSVTGFLQGEALVSATSGKVVFISPATAESRPGLYPIVGSGLTATNYMFVQDPANATALTVQPNIINQVSGTNAAPQAPVTAASGAPSTGSTSSSGSGSNSSSGSDAGTATGSQSETGAGASSDGAANSDSSDGTASSGSAEGAAGGAENGDTGATNSGDGGSSKDQQAPQQPSATVVAVEFEAADPLPPSPVGNEPTPVPSDTEDSSDPALAAISAEDNTQAVNGASVQEEIVAITPSVSFSPQKPAATNRRMQDAVLSINVLLNP